VIGGLDAVLRTEEVRRAARGWRDAGTVDAATLAKIEAAYPDERPRLTRIWKVLLFVVATVAIFAAILAVYMAFSRTNAAPLIVYGLVLAGVTEAFRDPKRTDNGIAAATSFWSLAFVLAGTGIALEERHAGDAAAVTWMLALAVVALALACWRWGFAAYGYAAVAAAFFLLARPPAGRALWFLAGIAAVVIVPRFFDRPSFSPPYRTAAAGAWVVGAAAFYTSVNRYALDHRWIESLSVSPGSAGEPSGIVRLLSSIATALLPILLVAWGIRSRRTLVLDSGVVAAALSLVTLRAYVHIVPLWSLLTAAGVLLVGAALGIGRSLRRAPGRERRGFTARSFSSRPSGLETAAVVAAFAPSAPRAPEPGGFSAGGGRYGGGGATGDV
jgi:heme/copper-type cytochrome/quinol oxidase subunit 3